MSKIEIYRVIVPVPCNQESKRFYEEVRRIFLNGTKGNILFEMSSPCKIHKVEVYYHSPVDNGDPLISVEIETSEVFKDLTEFKKFLEKAAA